MAFAAYGFGIVPAVKMWVSEPRKSERTILLGQSVPFTVPLLVRPDRSSSWFPRPIWAEQSPRGGKGHKVAVQTIDDQYPQSARSTRDLIET
jgi:hypothetical protein